MNGEEGPEKDAAEDILNQSICMGTKLFGQQSSRHQWTDAQNLLARDSLPAEAAFLREQNLPQDTVLRSARKSIPTLSVDNLGECEVD